MRNRLQLISDAAAGYMSRPAALEFVTAIADRLEELDDAGANDMQRFIFVHGELHTRIACHGLAVMSPGDAAACIVNTWRDARRAA